MKCLARVADWLFNRFAPLPNDGAEWLTATESAVESLDAFERWTSAVMKPCPQCFPEGWEEQVHDAVYEDDELWAASQRKDSAPIPPGAAPADAVPPSVGRHSPAQVISRTLRDLRVPGAHLIADSVALDLSHHFDFTHKK